MSTAQLQTVFGSIARHAGATPDKAAVIVGEDTFTYGRLAHDVGLVASGLRAMGLEPGDRVGVTTTNTIEHLVGEIGAMAAGGIPVALPNTDRVSYRAIIADAEPALVVGGAGTLGVQEAGGGDPQVHRLADVMARATDRGEQLLARPVEPDEIAMFYYTSGTSSGIRKGVMQSYRMLHCTAQYILEITRLTPDVREVVGSSLDNAYWFGRCRVVLQAGGTLLLHHGTLNPLAIIDTVRRNEGNAISGDTPVFLLLMNHLEKTLRQIAPAIRWVKIASQAMPVPDKRRALDIFPNARIVMGYGLTEAMRTSLLVFNDHRDKLDSDGPPCSGVSLKIVDDQGGEVPAAGVGEVLIGGSNMASGYWRKDAMWHERFDGRWYRSGDLGYLDSDGFLHLLGRKDDAINSGGKTIALSEVESRLRPHLQAPSFAVCGVPDPKGVLGDVIALCIEGQWAEKTDWKHLRIHLFECMEPAFVPKEAYCVPEFPRTTNQKIQLKRLREGIAEGRFQRM